MKRFAVTLSAIVVAAFLATACGGDDTKTTDDLGKTEADTTGTEDVVAPEDSTAPSDSVAPEDLTMPEDATGPEDVTAPEDVTEPEDVSTPDDVPAPNCNPEGNVANLKACAEGPVDVTLKSVTVTYVFEQGYFVQDNSGATEVYTTDEWPYEKVTVGQVISLHVTEYGNFHAQQEVVASDAPVIEGTGDAAGFILDISDGTLPAEDIESFVVMGTGIKVDALDGKNLTVSYGTAQGVTLRANEIAQAMCVGATFDLLTGVVTQYDEEHRLQAFVAADTTNINTDNCEAPVDADDSNWGFEEGGPNDPPADFVKDGDALTAEWTAEMAHSGNNGCKLTWTSADNQDLFQGFFMPITAGQTATFDLWAVDNDAAGRFRLCLEFYSDTFLSLKKEYSSTYTDDGADWAELTYAVDAPDSSAYVRAFVRMYDVVESWDGDASVYIDDWSLTVQ